VKSSENPNKIEIKNKNNIFLDLKIDVHNLLNRGIYYLKNGKS
jgi:hypothetical protein